MRARLWLELKAPFAAFRWLQAGVFRATSPVMPPSAAWGLVSNLAGIDTRGDDDGTTTLVRADATPLRVAIGAVAEPERASIYQQLHTYPVGNAGKESAVRAKGGKYWIAPARRELLVGFHCVVGVEGNSAVLERVRMGLQGAFAAERYGLPFAGDNNLLFDRIDAVDAPPPCRWYAPLGPDDPPVDGSCRLTVGIDRAEASKTTSLLCAPTAPAPQPPESAWTWVPRPPPEAA